jgi:acid stress-induced BolA-like protein IbaG/YrbA
MKANDIFTNSVKSRKSDIDFAKQRLAQLRKARATLMPIIKHLAPLIGEQDRIHVSGGEYYHSVNVYLNKLDGFKDVRLEQMLYAMMCFKNVEAKATSDYPELMSRTYRFTIPGDVEIGLSVEANVKGDSETCRKVKVGEKMEVVAEYAIQCD